MADSRIQTLSSVSLDSYRIINMMALINWNHQVALGMLLTFASCSLILTVSMCMLCVEAAKAKAWKIYHSSADDPRQEDASRERYVPVERWLSADMSSVV